MRARSMQDFLNSGSRAAGGVLAHPALLQGASLGVRLLCCAQAILDEEELKDAVILVYANKQVCSLSSALAAWKRAAVLRRSMCPAVCVVAPAAARRGDCPVHVASSCEHVRLCGRRSWQHRRFCVSPEPQSEPWCQAAACSMHHPSCFRVVWEVGANPLGACPAATRLAHAMRGARNPSCCTAKLQISQHDFVDSILPSIPAARRTCRGR